MIVTRGSLALIVVITVRMFVRRRRVTRRSMLRFLTLGMAETERLPEHYQECCEQRERAGSVTHLNQYKFVQNPAQGEQCPVRLGCSQGPRGGTALD